MFSLLRRILGELRPYRLQLGGYSALLLVSALAGIAVPLVTRRLIDHGLRHHSAHLVIELALLLIALGVLSAVASSVASAWGVIIGVSMMLDLRTRLYRHLQVQPLAFYARTPAGAILSRINNDVTEAQSLVRIVFGATSANVVTLLAAVATMAAISPVVTLVVLAAAAPLIIPARHSANRVHTLAHKQAQANRSLFSYLGEHINVAGALLRLMFNYRDRDLAEFARRADQVRTATAQRNMTFARSSFVLSTFSATGLGVAYLAGGLTHSLSVGSVVALAGLVKTAYDPMVTLVTNGISLTGGLVAFERVYEMLDFPPAVAEPIEPVPLPRPARTLEFRDVSFRHPGAAESTLASLLDDTAPPDSAHRLALDSISWRTIPEKMTAIVGPSGAGKTTITLLAGRFYDPDSGAVLLDGIDLRDLSLADIHRAIGMVTQDAYLLNDTLAANLRLAAADASDTELHAACDTACLGDLVYRLPHGLDTLMGDRGYRLSGGERQRLALARVFLADPDIVILDEATAHLDIETERAVQRALTGAFGGRTLVVVAHRLSTIERADQILVVDDGRIVERGVPETLGYLRRS